MEKATVVPYNVGDVVYTTFKPAFREYAFKIKEVIFTTSQTGVCYKIEADACPCCGLKPTIKSVLDHDWFTKKKPS